MVIEIICVNQQIPMWLDEMSVHLQYTIRTAIKILNLVHMKSDKVNNLNLNVRWDKWH